MSDERGPDRPSLDEWDAFTGSVCDGGPDCPRCVPVRLSWWHRLVGWLTLSAEDRAVW